MTVHRNQVICRRNFTPFTTYPKTFAAAHDEALTAAAGGAWIAPAVTVYLGGSGATFMKLATYSAAGRSDSFRISRVSR